MGKLLGVLGLCFFVAWGAVPPGDSEKGRELFRTQNCVACHSVNGAGGNLAPDLGRRIGRDYTPSGMAALMWNHAPAMWAAMEKKGITRPQLTEQEAADLFAFFYAARYFDKPGDAARGKQVFESKRCSRCHGISSAAQPGIKPVTQWQAVTEPVALAEQMWNHAAEMKAEMAKKNIQWPRLSSQELTDLIVYAQNLPGLPRRAGGFSAASAESGERLFKLKGCAGCHTGERALPGRSAALSLTGLAAAMWNHAPEMTAKPPNLNVGEMRRIVGYLWTQHVFERQGNPERGSRVFANKNCAGCHGDPSSGAPQLKGRRDGFGPFGIVAALWEHGPSMLKQFESKRFAWPRFTAGEMSNLIAYLDRP